MRSRFTIKEQREARAFYEDGFYVAQLTHNGVTIQDPGMDETMRFAVDPVTYYGDKFVATALVTKKNNPTARFA